MFKKFNITAVTVRQQEMASVEVETNQSTLLSKALEFAGFMKWKNPVCKIEIENQKDGSILIEVQDEDSNTLGFVMAGVSEDQ
jgi:hypothetical protein